MYFILTKIGKIGAVILIMLSLGLKSRFTCYLKYQIRATH